MKWTDVWQQKFRYDGYGYIWSKNDVMVFTVDIDRNITNRLIKNILADITTVLNGGEVAIKYDNLTIKDGCDLYLDGLIIGSFRGWGHLTGTGGLNLSNDEAVNIQDEMIEFVMNKLKK